MKQELEELDEKVSEKRDALPIAKQNRDSLRNTNIILRQNHGLLGNNNLLRDYGDKVVNEQNF